MIGEEMSHECGSHIVWLNDQIRIASFHPVEGFVEKCFASHSFFLQFLHSLQERGYRFQ